MSPARHREGCLHRGWASMKMPGKSWVRSLTFPLLTLAVSECWSVQPYSPVLSDPVLEPWRWRSFPELKGLGLRCLAEAKDGAIWFGADEGVHRYDGVEWTAYTPDDGLHDAPVMTLCATRDGSVYAGTESGISRFSEGVWHRALPPPDDLPWGVYDILEASDGSIWVGTDWGALHLCPEDTTLFTTRSLGAALLIKAPSLRLSIVPDKVVPARPWTRGIGIEVAPRWYSGVGKGPKLIYAIAPNGPGEAAGLKVGDLITAVDGETLVRVNQIEGPAGTSVTLTVERKGVAVPFDVLVERQRVEGRFRPFWINDVYEDREGKIWFGLSSGTQGGEILRYDPSTGSESGLHEAAWRLYSEKDGLDIGWLPRIIQSNGVIWTVSEHGGRGVNRFDGKEWTNFRLADLGGDDHIKSVIETVDGTLWVGGSGSLHAHRNGNWTVYRASMAPIPSVRIYGLLEGSDGALWVVGRGQEVVRLDYGSSRWTTYKGLRFQCETSDGTQWFLSRGEVVVRHVPGETSNGTSTWERYDTEDGLMDAPRKLVESRQGVIWASGHHDLTAATARFDGNRWFLNVHPRLSRSISKKGVYESSDGALWFGAAVGMTPELGHQGGVLRFDPFAASEQAWTHYRPPDVPPYIYGIGQTSDGKLWLGSSGSFGSFDGKTWTRLTKPKIFTTVTSVDVVYATPGGDLWVGTRTYGAFHYDGKTWERHDARDGLADSPIKGIYQTSDGTVWVSTSTAVSRFDGRTWYTDALPKEVIGTVRQTKDGSLWVNTGVGTIRYQPETEPPVTEIIVSLDRVSQPGNTIISWKGKDAWHITRENELQYAWRLDGGEWSNYSSERSKVFFSMASGDHTFEVKARDRDFNEDPTPDVLLFHVVPPVWGQAWFLGLMVVLISVIVTQTGRVARRDRRLRRSNAELRRDRALDRVRAEVTAMGAAEDLRVLTEGMLRELASAGVEFDLCVINILNEEAGVRHQYGATREGWSGQAEEPMSEVSDSFLQMWKARKAVVREVDDALAERVMGTRRLLGLETDAERPTAIVEAPFEYGTLSLNTTKAEGFSDDDVALIEELARVVALGYARFLDFQQLEEKNRALEEANQQVQEANRLKSQFLANMSHELRTPLNAILGFSQLMTRDSQLRAEQRENLEVIGRSGEHLLALINDVLEMSKIEAGQTTLNEEGFDLYRMLDGLEEMFHLRAEDKGLQLIFKRAPDVPQYVRADEGKLRQVLINLLGNGIKFTREGGVTLRVEYELHPGHGKESEARLLFEVEDTGPGIALDEVEILFEAFGQTAAGQKAQEGTGLGLPISQEYVRLMGGEITVSSEVDQGATFRFAIQIGLVDAEEVQTREPARKVIGLEPDQPVYRILVVEDKWENRKLLVNLLEPLGFGVREAENGQEGIEVWEEWEPHLIWMDMRMPVMDGHEATQRIKSTTKGQATVIVALTASAFEEERTVVLSEGCDGFVRKPFREEEVFDAMAEHLGVRFVYEEEAEGASAEPAPREALTPEALSGLPADWVAELHRATTQADADLILSMLERIESDHALLAKALGDLVHDFRFDKILAVTGELPQNHT